MMTRPKRIAQHQPQQKNKVQLTHPPMAAAVALALAIAMRIKEGRDPCGVFGDRRTPHDKGS
jgi:hypothetical protein